MIYILFIPKIFHVCAWKKLFISYIITRIICKINWLYNNFNTRSFVALMNLIYNYKIMDWCLKYINNNINKPINKTHIYNILIHYCIPLFNMKTWRIINQFTSTGFVYPFSPQRSDTFNCNNKKYRQQDQ